jgi:hypothetical protein
VTPSLPPGVKVVPFYDRSTLIERAVGTVENALARSDGAGRHAAAAVPGRAARRAGGGADAAAGGAGHLLADARGRHERQPDELGGLAIAIGMLVDALPWWWWKTPSVGSTRTHPVRTSRACTAYSRRRARSPRPWPRASSSSV